MIFWRRGWIAKNSWPSERGWTRRRSRWRNSLGLQSKRFIVTSRDGVPFRFMRNGRSIFYSPGSMEALKIKSPAGSRKNAPLSWRPSVRHGSSRWETSAGSLMAPFVRALLTETGGRRSRSANRVRYSALSYHTCLRWSRSPAQLYRYRVLAVGTGSWGGWIWCCFFWRKK